MDRMHIHVEGVGLKYATEHHVRPEDRDDAQHILRVKHARVGRDAFQDRRVGVELRFLPRRGDEHGAARRNEGIAGEARRRRLQEGAAGHGQRAHLRRAIAFHEQRGRPAGRVIPGVCLALKQDDAPAMGKPVARGGGRDAGADHDEIGGVRHR